MSNTQINVNITNLIGLSKRERVKNIRSLGNFDLLSLYKSVQGEYLNSYKKYLKGMRGVLYNKDSKKYIYKNIFKDMNKLINLIEEIKSEYNIRSIAKISGKL